jgi:acyl-CoA thioesterase
MEGNEIIQKMMANDKFSQWLGISIIASNKGYCKLSMRIREEMLNGFGIAHGGITYSLADSALAFASNSMGPKSLSVETSISHICSLNPGDEIVAEATNETETGRLGHYRVKVYRPATSNEPVAIFKGIVYKTSKNW